MNAPNPSLAIVFLAWGENAMANILRLLDRSQSIEGYDLILITDRDTSCELLSERLHAVVRVEFRLQGYLRKCELLEHLPTGYGAYCFLDVDTIVLGDISLGFEKALQHGIAMSPAPHYSLDHFWEAGKIMTMMSVAHMGQLLYNSGVIFFSLQHPGTRSVFTRWRSLAEPFQEIFNCDQSLLTLAMELEGFNPYTLSIGYNYRGFGDHISGLIRIWHSYGDPPPELNVFDQAWPPRRAWPDRLERL